MPPFLTEHATGIPGDRPASRRAPIDLIDGDRLCDLLKKYDLGVSTTTRTVEDVTISAAFFADI